MHLPQILFGVFVVFVACGPALLLGDRPAKLMGAACLIAYVATVLLQDHGNHFSPQYGVAAVDTVLLAIVIYLAVTYRRTWLVLAGGFMMLIVANHFAFAVDLRMVANIRATAANVWGYLMLACLVWGTWTSWRDRRAPAAEPPTGG